MFTPERCGARVVYQVLNPPYPEWSAQFPALQDGVLAAAESTGADSSTIAGKLGLTATPVEQAIATTLRSYQHA